MNTLKIIFIIVGVICLVTIVLKLLFEITDVYIDDPKG